MAPTQGATSVAETSQFTIASPVINRYESWTTLWAFVVAGAAGLTFWATGTSHVTLAVATGLGMLAASVMLGVSLRLELKARRSAEGRAKAAGIPLHYT